jgi:hypothetical protein
MLPRSYDMEERDTTGDLYWEAPTDGESVAGGVSSNERSCGQRVSE